MAKPQKKRCSHCGRAKPKEAFPKDKYRPDGLYGWCKQCVAESTGREASGLEVWSQVGDSLRAMAEMQAVIDEENSSRNHRITLINEYSDKIIEPYEVTIKAKKNMIKDFLVKAGRKTMKSFEVFRFGKVRLSRGKLIIKLNTELAARQRGKP